MQALHRYLTWTPSRLLCVALTDAVGDTRAQNQPGTIDEYPNWRVPLTAPDGTVLTARGRLREPACRRFEVDVVTTAPCTPLSPRRARSTG